ncbi:translocation protein, partial [Basidiobolus meristosporus CBS 931.73]
PKEHFKVAEYLLNTKNSGLKPREGVVNGRRVNYFKGKSACNALLRPSYVHKSRPKVASRQEAEELMQELLQSGLIIKCERNDRNLTIVPMQTFQEEGYYAWLYEGSQMKTILGGIGLVAIVLIGVMFPLWPPIMRDGAWYVSVGILGLLGLLMVTAIVRLIFFVITFVVCKPGIWIFPNLFEDVGFFESFVPLYAWEVPSKKKGKEAITAPDNAAPSEHASDSAATEEKP